MAASKLSTSSTSKRRDLDQSRKNVVIRWSSFAIISAIVSLGAWAFSSPIGSAPDDDYHNVSIWCGQGLREGLCEQGSEPAKVLVRETLKSNSFCFAGKPLESGYCEQTEALGETARTNRGENPVVYYWVTSWFASDNIDFSVLTIRIFNSILVVLAFASVIWLLPRNLRRVPLIGMLATSMPLGMFIIASTNPSAWAATSVIVFFSAFVGLLSTKEIRKRWLLGILAFVTLIMAAGSRPDSAFYIVISIGVAIVLLFTKKMLSGRNIAIVGLLVALPGAFFLAAGNTSATISGAPGGGLEVTTVGRFFLNLVELPSIWVGVFGNLGLGWMDTVMPSIVWAVTYGIFFFFVFAAIKYFDSRQWAAATLVLLSLVVIPMAALSASGLVVGQFIQPRYLLPLLGLLVAVTMFRRSDKSGIELSDGQMWLIGVGLFVTHLLSLYQNLQRYLTGFGDNDIIEWWWVEIPADGTIFWFSPNYVWLVGAFAFGLFLFSLWKLRVELGLPGDSAGSYRETERQKAASVSKQKKKPLSDKKSTLARKKKSQARKSQL